MLQQFNIVFTDKSNVSGTRRQICRQKWQQAMNKEVTGYWRGQKWSPALFQTKNICLLIHTSIQPLSVPIYTNWGPWRAPGAYSSYHWGKDKGHIRYRQTTIHTYGLSYRKCRIANYPNMHVFGLWEETRVPRENSHKTRENMQTPCRKAPGRIQTRNLLATVLTN